MPYAIRKKSNNDRRQFLRNFAIVITIIAAAT